VSCYDDIYNDYPLRCATIWDCFHSKAADQKLDVTFMLMCAAGGFAMPWEHLKIQAGQAKDNRHHPAFLNYDKLKYERSLSSFEKALEVKVSASPLFRQVNVDLCFYGHAKTINLIRDMAEYRKPVSEDFGKQGSRVIVKALRNALAHNNVYAFSKSTAKEISDLAFFSEVLVKGQRDKVVDYYEVIAMSVNDFQVFLSAWFELIRSASQSKSHLKLVVSNALEEFDDRIAAHG